jgi:hypothetical protein
MIRMMGLIDLLPLAEDQHDEPTPEHPDEQPEPEKKLDTLRAKLERLKEMNLGEEQEKKVDAMLAKMQPVPSEEPAPTEEIVLAEEDHAVSMANNLLDDIIKNVTELKEKMGQEEKDIPAWIQNHISQSQNFISQANVNYHESEAPGSEAPDTETPPTDALQEGAPTGWEGTVQAMKKHKEIDNPWSLAHWMKKRGYEPTEEGMVKTANKAKSRAYVKSLGTSPKTPQGWSGPETNAAYDKRTVRAGREKMVKNPKTGKEILATTAAKDPSHPAHSAAKSALGKK